MKLQPDYAELFELPPAERLQLVEDLSDSLTPSEADSPASDWVVRELRERKKHFDANPESAMRGRRSFEAWTSLDAATHRQS